MTFLQSKSKNQNTAAKAVLPLSINNEKNGNKRTPEGCKGVPKRQSVNTENVRNIKTYGYPPIPVCQRII